MLAGVTRIIEICFFAPKLSGDTDDDNRSDHTLNATSTTENGSSSTASRAFRHLPPFVSIRIDLLPLRLVTDPPIQLLVSSG